MADVIRRIPASARNVRRQVRSGASRRVRANAGRYDGTMSNWYTERTGLLEEGNERHLIAARSQDLVNNDPHAASTIDSIALGAVGTGMAAQSIPDWVRLGWTEDQAADVARQCETVFADWSTGVDINGRLPFWGMQYTSIQSMLVHGEFFRIPVMQDPAKTGRPLALALQGVSPSRVATPVEHSTDYTVRDGVRLEKTGRIRSCYVYNPADLTSMADDPSGEGLSEFTEIPFRIGHRPGILHGFAHKSDEQYRGMPILAPAMKFFRDLSDYLDYELVGAIVAASFPVFIEDQLPDVGYNPMQRGTSSTSPRSQLNVAPGQVLYGNAGQRPHVLSSPRPGGSFPVFVERLIRAVGASVGMPYEVISKDFSQTNYSSARAALLEAWRVFGFYQRWLVDMLCRPVWSMVIEEAYLRNLIDLPAGTDFYRDMRLICRSEWIPPRRGFVDPGKEIQAYADGIDNDILTLAQAITEMTGQDWETVVVSARAGREKAGRIHYGAARKDRCTQTQGTR